MCNSLQHTPARTANVAHQIRAHHETSDYSPTGVMDRQIFCANEEKEQSGGKGFGSSRPDQQQQHDCKKNPTTHNDDNDGKDSSRPPPAYQYAVPRSISITSSNASSTTSAADRTDEALLAEQHESSSSLSSLSLSSLSSFGSINENPPVHPPTPAPVSEPKTESKSPISPRRAIFDSYWKRSPTSSSQQQPSQASKPSPIGDGRDEKGVQGAVPANQQCRFLHHRHWYKWKTTRLPRPFSVLSMALPVNISRKPNEVVASATYSEVY